MFPLCMIVHFFTCCVIKLSEIKMCIRDSIYAAGDAVQVKHYVTGNDALISLAGPANKPVSYTHLDVYKRQEEGSPQGGNLSPLLANIYLNEFDQE